MKKEDVPGKRQRDKVKYLTDQGYAVKEIAEILETSTAAVYQNKSELRKEKKVNEIEDPFATTTEETPFDFPAIPTYTEPTPVHKIEEKAPTLEIALDNMDGATVKALIAITNNKLDNEKSYRLHILIEEQ